MEGLREKDDPYKHFALQGTLELLERGGKKILPLVPVIVPHIKAALATRNPGVVTNGLKVVQALVQSNEEVGAILVDHYSQILPVLNLMKNKNASLGELIQ